MTPLYRNSAAEKKGAMFTQVHPGSPLATIILVRLVSKFHHFFTVNRDENHHPKGSLPFFEWWLTSRVTQKYSVPCMLADYFQWLAMKLTCKRHQLNHLDFLMPSGSDRNMMAYISNMRREIIKEVKTKLF